MKDSLELKKLSKIRQLPINDAAILSDFVYKQISNNHLANISENEFRKIAIHSTNQENFKNLIRNYRNERIKCLIQRQFQSPENTLEVMKQCSNLADFCIELCQEWAEAFMSSRFGVPQDENGKRQKLMILAMGKLGGQELNLSSDVDLIFTFGKQGYTSGGKKAWANEEYFTRLTQLIITLLNDVTSEGFVFRVDTRLRPFGASGPIVSNLDVLEEYYLQHGRGWERFSMIKARAVTGLKEDRQRIRNIIDSFVYRKYLDFSLLETPRRIKRQIEAELRKRNFDNNLKLGKGGIREIEFIVQSIQLIHGGKNQTLKVRSTLDALSEIYSLNLIDAEECEILKNHYLKLRFWEHCLQGFEDKQTQTLPQNSLNQERLCFISQKSNWDEWIDEYHRISADIHHIFKKQFREKESVEKEFGVDPDLLDLWLIPDDYSENYELLQKLGYKNSKEIIELLKKYKPQIDKKINRGFAGGKEKVYLLLAYVLEICSNYHNSKTVLKHMVELIETLTSKSVYLKFFIENKKTLTLLGDIFSKSNWIANYVKSCPMVIDDLLNPAWLDQKEFERKKAYLSQQLARIPEDDEEQILAVLAEYRHSIYFQLASRFVQTNLSSRLLGQYLTETAEIIVSHCYQLASTRIKLKYGELLDDQGHEVEFSIIGFGKLGSRELGFDSDLDMVFIFEDKDCHSSGKKSLDTLSYFIKVAQKMIHYLTAKFPHDFLYEIDTRLRPSGNSGLLVSAMKQFEQYQLNEAWTWEHQAMVRSRVVMGSDKMKTRFQSIKSKVLCQLDNSKELLFEINKMRRKMRQSLSQNGSLKNRLKQMPGGIIDIEFLAQYLVLKFGKQYQQLTRQTNTSELFLMLLELKILSTRQTNQLIEGFENLIDSINQNYLEMDQFEAKIPESSLVEVVSTLQQFGISSDAEN